MTSRSATDDRPTPDRFPTADTRRAEELAVALRKAELARDLLRRCVDEVRALLAQE
jgi:hypothetical protein